MKKYLYIIVGLLVIAGITFALTNTDLLKGTFTRGPQTGGIVDTTDYDAEDLLGLAEETLNHIYDVHGDAADWLGEAQYAYENADADFLAEAQAETAAAASLANTYYENIQSYAERAEVLYDEAYDAWEESDNYTTELAGYVSYYLGIYNGTTEEMESLSQEIDAAASALTACRQIQEEGSRKYVVSCDAEEEALEEAQNSYNESEYIAEVAEENWSTYYDLHAESYTNTEELSTIKNDTEDFLSSFQDYETEALSVATEVQDFADTAAAYVIDTTTEPAETTTTTTYSCSSLEISPDTYAIAYDATSVGDMDFTVTINFTETQVTSWNFMPWMLKAFSLIEEEEIVDIIETADGASATGTSYDRSLDSSTSATAIATIGSFTLSTDGSGTITDSSGTEWPSGSTLNMIASPYTETFTYSGGAVGNTITATVTDSTICSDTLTITQEAGPDVDTTTDTDGDGLTDYEETNTCGTDPSLSDTDGDGLSDYAEVITYGTNPNLADTDSDGMDDAWEISYGLDPLTNNASEDPDSDGYTNLQEYTNGTNPIVADAATTTPTDTTPDPDLTDDEVDEIISSPQYTCRDPFTDTNGHWAEDLICRLYQAGTVSGYGAQANSFGPNNDITRAEWIKILVKTAGYDESDASNKTESFADVNEDDWYHDYIVIAEDLDVIRVGDFGDYFNPNVAITRADTILYTVRMANQQLWGWDADDIAFDDVYVTDYFAYAVVIANITKVNVPNEGTTPVIEGSNGEFRPYDYITRAEAVAVAMRSYLAWFR